MTSRGRDGERARAQDTDLVSRSQLPLTSMMILLSSIHAWHATGPLVSVSTTHATRAAVQALAPPSAGRRAALLNGALAAGVVLQPLVAFGSTNPAAVRSGHPSLQEEEDRLCSAIPYLYWQTMREKC